MTDVPTTSVDAAIGAAERRRTWGTIGSLTLGSLLMVVSLATAGWAVAAVWFGWVSGLVPLLGVVVLGALSIVILAYAWALLVRGLTDVVRMGVNDALVERQ